MLTRIGWVFRVLGGLAFATTLVQVSPTPSGAQPAVPQVLVQPRFLETSTEFSRQIGVQFNAPTFATNVDELGLPTPIARVFQESGLALHVEQFLPKAGVDPNNLQAAPRGSVDITWGVDFFGSGAAALAVDHTREANLLNEGFHPRPLLSAGGVSVFSRRQPPTPGLTVNLTNQIYYYVDHNAMLSVADTGKFPIGGRQNDEVAVFSDIRKELQPLGILLILKPTMTRSAAGDEYAGLALSVNDANQSFMDGMAQWTPATTGQQAYVLAEPYMTLNGVEARLRGIVSRYPPARSRLVMTMGALESLRADLLELPLVSAPESSGWVPGLDATLAGLKASSNAARSALGLSLTP